MATDI